MTFASDYEIAFRQYIKIKRAEVRLRYTLMADAEIARSKEGWQMEFEKQASVTAPQVLDLESEAERLYGSNARELPDARA